MKRIAARELFYTGCKAAQKHLGFYFLHFPKKTGCVRGGAGAVCCFTGVNKGERVPTALRGNLGNQARIRFCFQRSDAAGNFGNGRMGAHTMEPVFGISIVRFAAMHDAVEERAIGVLDGLRDYMGTVEMIVPQKHQGPYERLFGTGDFAAIEKFIERFVYG